MVEARKLDYELLERWIKYMAKPTDKYKYKDAWQAMMKKGGGTQSEAKKLARQVPGGHHGQVMLQKNDMDAQNKVLTDKDLDGTKPKKRTDKPSNFVSNKDFNPGALIRFKVAAGRTDQLLDRDFRARTEGHRRSQRHGGMDSQTETRRACCSAAGDWKPGLGRKRRRV